MVRNTSLRVLYGAMMLVIPMLAAAEPQPVVVLSRDFEQDQSLLGCRNVAGTDLYAIPLDKCPYRVLSETGNSFLRSTKASGIFGMTMPLKRPLLISAGTARVELKVRVRRTRGGWLAMALTSRTQPEAQQGQAFEFATLPADSGFAVSGYEIANEVDALTWRVEGLSRTYSEHKAFLPDAGQEWHQWRVVFDRAASTLTLYTGEGVEVPVLVQKGVDLDDITLRSLWLGGSGASAPDAECYADYDDIVVCYTPAG